MTSTTSPGQAVEFEIPDIWQPFRLTTEQVAAAEAVLAAFTPDARDPWELRPAAEATLAEHASPEPDLVVVRGTWKQGVGTYPHIAAVNLIAPDGSGYCCYVSTQLARPAPEDPTACLVLGRRIEEGETVLVELFSQSDLYQIRVHKLSLDGPYSPPPTPDPAAAADPAQPAPDSLPRRAREA